MRDCSATATVHVTARVPVDLARAFEKIALEEDRSVSAELRRLMRQHVATEHGRDRDSSAGTRSR